MSAAGTPAPDSGRLEEETRAIGRQLHRRAESLSRSDRRTLVDGLLDVAMGSDALRTDLFRFIDVLPMLRDHREVARHVREYLAGSIGALPPVLAAAVKAAGGDLAAGVSSRAIRALALQIADRFIAGATVAKALERLASLHREGYAFSADLLGEATVSDAEAASYADRYAALIDELAAETAAWPEQPLVDRGHLGRLPRAGVSLKLSSLSAHLDPVDHAGAVRRLAARVLPLAARARERGVALTVDMEQWETHGIAWDLFEELATSPQLAGWPYLGIVIQAYLRQAAADLARLVALARRRGAPLAVRLVKGAYWDAEVVRARQLELPCPVFLSKGHTDAAFEALALEMAGSIDWLVPGFGTHNLRSIGRVLAAGGLSGAPREALELQMLYGMAEAERRAAREMEIRVRLYAPIGDLLPGVAYLVRRLLENTANTGFLRQSRHEHRDVEELLVPPAAPAHAPGAPTPAPGLSAPFRNCPRADFVDPQVRSTYARAVEQQGRGLPIRVPVAVAGRERVDGRSLAHPCPGERGRPATLVTLGTVEEVETAVGAAADAWPAWRERPVEARAASLDRLGDLLFADRHSLAALQCWEVGKPIREAEADVAEAIDYCRYYARQAVAELSPRPFTAMSGEDNSLAWEGRGVAAVIAPWNFPLAILCGMTTAALVAGNTVVMKPAEQSSGLAWRLYERMREAGFPHGVVQFLPGIGEEVGSRLAAHPGVAQLAFTGSRSVGLAILAAAGATAAGQRAVKRVVCEMGGKNAIIVDDDADLDEAVQGVVRSAFGYAGQKCSACSRAIVLAGVWEPFVSRLLEATRSLVTAPAHEPGCELGPVIDETAFDRLQSVIADPGPGVERLFVGPRVDGGFFVPAAIFAASGTAHRLMQEELFGPVLTLLRVPDFAAALRAAADSDYALTGGLYCRSPSRQAEARRSFRVGNLYLNRAITGAVVGRQPFGGFAMSGTGTKAGGPGYLAHFADPRTICENTMRRGFVPSL